MTPEVSVIVPAYKTEPYLRICLDSLLGQTLENIEIIVVDDGSPDGCGAICDEYAARDGRVQVIHKENGGVISAILAGLSLARAPWVGFVDSDDWIDPAYYADLTRTAARTGADVTVAEHVTHRPEGEESFIHPDGTVYPSPDGGQALLRVFFSSAVAHPPMCRDVFWKCDKLYRRQLLLDNLPYFRREVWHGEDLLMNAAILADCPCVALVNGGAKYHYLVRDQSASHGTDRQGTTDRYASNELYFLRALCQIIDEKDLDRSATYAYLGQVAYTAIFNYSLRRDVSLGAKRRYTRQILAPLPAQALDGYARCRRSLPVRVYCALLRARIVTPCILACQLFDRLSGKRRDA